MTLQPASGSPSETNGSLAPDPDSPVPPEDRYPRSASDQRAATRRIEELVRENRLLKEHAEHTKLLNWFACLAGLLAMGVGTAILIKTFEARVKYHTDFIVGISGGCVLIVAVLGLFALAITSSRQSTL